MTAIRVVYWDAFDTHRSFPSATATAAAPHRHPDAAMLRLPWTVSLTANVKYCCGIVTLNWLGNSTSTHVTNCEGGGAARAGERSPTLHVCTRVCAVLCRSYIAASYVKWIEAAGGRVVPIRCVLEQERQMGLV